MIPRKTGAADTAHEYNFTGFGGQFLVERYPSFDCSFKLFAAGLTVENNHLTGR
jgi:hypothetical protein